MLETEEYTTKRFSLSHDDQIDRVEVTRYSVIHNDSTLLRRHKMTFKLEELAHGLDGCKCHCAWRLVCTEEAPREQQFSIIGTRDEIIGIYHTLL